jgi:hypothetical protein
MLWTPTHRTTPCYIAPVTYFWILGTIRSFHNRCTRSMCRITMAHTIRCRVCSRDPRARLDIQSLDRYYHHRTLRWAGHVARMPMSRLPRKLLTGFVAHSRPTGCPDMTWGRSLKKALKSNDLPTEFGEWTAIAKDRVQWRAAVHAKDTPIPKDTPISTSL